MSPLALNTLLFKEHVGMFKAANNYDILDPQTEIYLSAFVGEFHSFFHMSRSMVKTKNLSGVLSKSFLL